MKGEIIETRRVDDYGQWEYTRTYIIDGLEVTEEAFRSAFPTGDPSTISFSRAISGAKPWASDALAVHPKQIEQVLARNKKHGLNIPYDIEGRPVCTDAGQRKKLMKIEGVIQKNSYTGY